MKACEHNGTVVEDNEDGMTVTSEQNVELSFYRFLDLNETSPEQTMPH